MYNVAELRGTPEKTSVSVVGTLSAKQVTDVRLVQFLKALLPMLVTLLPIVTDVSLEQPLKVSPPILVTLLGIFIDVSPRQ